MAIAVAMPAAGGIDKGLGNGGTGGTIVALSVLALVSPVGK